MANTTQNLNFELIDFNIAPWHTKEHNNWIILDAIIHAYLNISNVVGIWKNSTSYLNGQRVIDGKTGQIFTCRIGHTSPAFGSFAADRLARPENWKEVISFTDIGVLGKLLLQTQTAKEARTILNVREPITANTTVYVRTTGSDSNDGLTLAKAKRTLNNALTVISNTFDPQSYQVTINFDGVYNENITHGSYIGSTRTFINITGASATTSILTGNINISGKNSLSCSNFHLLGTIYVDYQSTLLIQAGMSLTNTSPSSRHLLCRRQSNIVFNASGGTVNIAGDAQSFLSANESGVISFATSANLNFVDNPVYNIACIEAFSGGTVSYLSTNTYTGSPIGKKYDLNQLGSILSTSPNIETTLPGTLQGSCKTNGIISGMDVYAKAQIVGTTGAITSSFGINSVVRNSNANYTINFQVPQISSYTITVNGTNAPVAIRALSYTETSANFSIYNVLTGALFEAPILYLTVTKIT